MREAVVESVLLLVATAAEESFDTL